MPKKQGCNPPHGRPGSAPVTVPMQGVNQQMEALLVSLSLSKKELQLSGRHTSGGQK